jgi:hypothetical protein
VSPTPSSITPAGPSRTGPNPSNSSFSPSMPSYTLGGAPDLDRPRRKLSIVQSIKQSLNPLTRISPVRDGQDQPLQPGLTPLDMRTIEEGNEHDPEHGGLGKRSSRKLKPLTSQQRRLSAPGSMRDRGGSPTRLGLGHAHSRDKNAHHPGLEAQPSQRRVHFQGSGDQHSMLLRAQSMTSPTSGSGNMFISTDDPLGFDSGSTGIGTLTGWQMLAEQVMAEQQAGAAAASGGSSRLSRDKGGGGGGSRRKHGPDRGKRQQRKSRLKSREGDDENSDGGRSEGGRSEGGRSEDGRSEDGRSERSDTGGEKSGGPSPEDAARRGGVLKAGARGGDGGGGRGADNSRIPRSSSNTKLVRFSEVAEVDDMLSGVSSKDLFRSLRWNEEESLAFQERYELKEHIGSGAYGKAYRAKRRADGADFVVKVMQVGTMSSRQKREARNEVTLLSSLDHPNIVKYYECVVEGEQMYIVMVS